MAVINIGSLNIDWVYAVPHVVAPGETLAAGEIARHIGGKGLNQSIALARAGLDVQHVGAVGVDGQDLLDALVDAGVNTDSVFEREGQSGHAIIQVTAQGENAIIIHAGANASLTEAEIDAVFAHTKAKACLLQNETNIVAYAMRVAKAQGLQVFYNPAPMLPQVSAYPLDSVYCLILNEHEAGQLTGEVESVAQLEGIAAQWPHLITVLTRGAEGVMTCHGGGIASYPAVPVETVVDTTGAGDTFVGYFIASFLNDSDLEKAVQRGMQAASICISRPGASCSIP